MQKPSTKIKRKVSKATGIPTTSSGRKRKAQKAATGGGCLIPVILCLTALAMSLIAGCSTLSEKESATEPTTKSSKIIHHSTIPVTTEEPTTEAPTTEEPTTEAPTTEEPTTEKPTEPPTDPPTEAVSREYQNAIKKAENYLSFSAFSKDGLYEQLLYEKFSEDAAQYAVNNVTTDWNKNALKKAEDYMDMTAFSKEGLYEQLIYEKYTDDQARYAVDNIIADWNAAAVTKAKSYLELSPMSKDQLYEQLIFEKFTPEQAQYAVDQVY